MQRYDDGALVGRITPEGPSVRRRADAIGATSRVVGLLLKLTLLAILLTALVGLLGVIGVGGRATATIGERIGGAFDQGVGAVARAVQTVRDVADPAHPPRQAIAQDTEFDELIRLDLGAPIGGAANRTLVFTAVQRRDGADTPDSAVYATIHSELTVPQETRVMGILLRSTRDPQDHYLYKGESFRVGRRLYKVNWVSLDRQQMAIAAYRDPDRVTAPLKFEVD